MGAKARRIGWTDTLACTVLAVAANVIIIATLGFDLSSLLIKVVFPVGLMALGVVAMLARPSAIGQKRTLMLFEISGPENNDVPR